MLTHQTTEKLYRMRLSAMAEAFKEQLAGAEADGLSFEERFGLIVDRQWTARRNRRLARLLKEARLRLQASPEDIDYRHPRGLDRSVMRSLLTCGWLDAHRNVIITGPTGVGKTFIACALANAACRQGFRARYYRVPRPLGDLTAARGDGTYPHLLSQLGRTDLLVLDDWGLVPVSGRGPGPSGNHRRPGHDPLHLAGQPVPLEHWHKVMADPTVGDAILDRIVHNAYKISLKGESMRKAMAARTSNEEPSETRQSSGTQRGWPATPERVVDFVRNTHTTCSRYQP